MQDNYLVLLKKFFFSIIGRECVNEISGNLASFNLFKIFQISRNFFMRKNLIKNKMLGISILP